MTRRTPQAFPPAVRAAVVDYMRGAWPARRYVAADDVLTWALAKVYGYVPTTNPNYPPLFGSEKIMDVTDTDWLAAAWLEHMVQMAEKDAVVFDACNLAVDHYLEHGKAVPPELALFERECRAGQRTRPDGSKAHANTARNEMICRAVKLAWRLLDTKHATRSDSSPPHSPCDLVAECLRDQLHIPIGFDGVRKIWADRRFVGE